MTWAVEFADEFEVEFDTFTAPVKVELLARARFLARFGPTLGRPYVDTLYGSQYRNLKELRFNAGVEVWRVAFAFDPERKAILLCGGNKDGKDQKRFYQDLLRVADRRFKLYLESLGK
ncbi:MAG: type II toxin-antitoxin system RelE/ParE family toxin [Pseudomonadota bacterium]